MPTSDRAAHHKQPRKGENMPKTAMGTDFINNRYRKPGSNERPHPEVTRMDSNREFRSMVDNILRRDLCNVLSVPNKQYTLRELEVRLKTFPQENILDLLNSFIENGDVEEITGRGATYYRYIQGGE